MPDNKKNVPKGMIDRIQSSINNLYGSTYYNSREGRNALNQVKDNINASMDAILTNSLDKYGMNISALYNKIASRDKDMMSSIQELFDNQAMTNNILDAYTFNTNIKDHDNDIDLICTLMKKLDRALNMKKDLVLAADDFTNNTFSVSNKLMTSENETKFGSNIDDIKKTFNIMSLIDELYANTSRYGEQFVYIVPYKKELADLLYKNKLSRMNNDQYNQPFYNMQRQLGKSNISESVEVHLSEDIIKYFNNNNINLNIDISISNTKNYIPGILSESRIITTQGVFDNIKEYNFEDYRSNDNSQEGLITDKDKDKLSKEFENITGCIVKILDRENIIPLYIDNICMGYYYIEVNRVNDVVQTTRNAPFKLAPSSMSSRSSVNMDSDQYKENVLKSIVGELSRKIDEKFIKTNENFKKEIYAILKYNDIFSDTITSFKVHYIEPQYITHWYFKKDKKTGRGISDIEESIIPAILYSYIYITTSIAVLTRGYDKRVFYLKQTVDTNISANLNNAIDQLKRSNFGIRDIMGQMRGMFNILGRYNDHIIPMSNSGEKPMDIEVIPGQDIRPPEELMKTLEKLALDPIDIGVEAVDMTTSIEYSRQIAVSNGNTARSVMKRQLLVSPLIEDMINKIYKYQYNEEIISHVKLPKPTTLSMMGLIEIINSSKQVADLEFEMTCPQELQNERVGFIYKRKLYEKRIGTYVEWEVLDKLLEDAKIEAKSKPDDNNNSGY